MEHLQNDPERAGGLIVDPPGGIFDPHAFRGGSSSEGGSDAVDASLEPSVDAPAMVGPDGEIDKAH